MAKKDFRTSLVSMLLQAAIALGVCNHTLDHARGQLVYSGRAYVYRMSLHLAAFIVMAVNFSKLLSDVVAMVHEKDFAMQLGFICTNLNMVIIVLSLVTECPVRPEELTAVRRHAWKLLVLKTLSITAIVCTLVLSAIAFAAPTAVVLLYLSSMVVLVIMVLAFQFQFSMAMLYGAYLFKGLNLRISQLVEEVNRSLFLSRKQLIRVREELRELGCLHTTLLQLVIAIKDIYQFDILLMLASGLLYQVCAVFYFFLATRGLLLSVPSRLLLFQATNTCVTSVDLLLSFHICVDCVEACDAAGSILRGLTTFLILDTPLERDVDILTFQFAREKLHLSLFGLFDLDANASPAFFIQIILYLILLTQITYFEL